MPETGRAATGRHQFVAAVRAGALADVDRITGLQGVPAVDGEGEGAGQRHRGVPRLVETGGGGDLAELVGRVHRGGAHVLALGGLGDTDQAGRTADDHRVPAQGAGRYRQADPVAVLEDLVGRHRYLPPRPKMASEPSRADAVLADSSTRTLPVLLAAPLPTGVPPLPLNASAISATRAFSEAMAASRSVPGW